MVVGNALRYLRGEAFGNLSLKLICCSITSLKLEAGQIINVSLLGMNSPAILYVEITGRSLL